MKEEWRAVPGFPRYEVSDQGRIRSVRYKGTSIPKMLNPSLCRDGYRKLGLFDHESRRKFFRVPRLVLLTFVGEPGAVLEAAHLNGCRTDDRLDNLVWATRKENADHQILHGTVSKGEMNPKAKLNEGQVRNIRASQKNSFLLAAIYGVSAGAIRGIKSKKTWRHI